MVPKINGSVTYGDESAAFCGKVYLADEIGAEDEENVFLARTGLVSGEEKDYEIRLVKNESLREGAYRLAVDVRATFVEASTREGIGYGLTTLAGMIRENSEVHVCQVEDAPRMKHRGLALDVARHFFSAEEVKKVIEEMSWAKMNVLHWHLADDQGFRIESKKFPRLQEKSQKFYTQDEIRDIVDYARARGVEIIPEIDMPGHVTAILAAYPSLSCSGKEVEVGTEAGIYRDIFCAGKEETFSFVKELLDEVCELFPSKYFHIGGDEAPKSAWKVCPDCQRRMKQLGLTEYEDLQGYFARRVGDYLQTKGKTIVSWNDATRAHVQPKPMRMQYWSLNFAKESEAFAAEGNEWVYSDMFEIYFDYPYSMTPVKKVYESVPHFGSIPCTDKTMPLGMEACLWTEHVTTNERLEELLFPRLYALAEACWSGAGDYEEFCGRLEKENERLKEDGIHVTESSWWDPEGPKRQKEAFGYLAAINSGMSKERKEQTAEDSAPSPEFGQAFTTKFFRPEDLPILMGGQKQ